MSLAELAKLKERVLHDETLSQMEVVSLIWAAEKTETPSGTGGGYGSTSCLTRPPGRSYTAERYNENYSLRRRLRRRRGSCLIVSVHSPNEPLVLFKQSKIVDLTVGFPVIDSEEDRMRYMLAFTWKVAPDITLVESEHRQVIRLIAEGRMEQILLAHDRTRGWLVMVADNEAKAREAASTLPFYPSMNIDVTPLVQTYP